MGPNRWTKAGKIVWPSAVVAASLLLGISAAALSASSIQLIVNGKEIRPDVAPQLVDGRVLVPIRAAAEALGAEVRWVESKQSVEIDHREQRLQEMRIAMLEKAISPKTPLEAVESWAEAVATRNGALQYAVYSEELKPHARQRLEENNWVSGVSSPWVESYTIKELDSAEEKKRRFEVNFVMKTSADNGVPYNVEVLVKQEEERWVLYEFQGEGNDWMYYRALH